MRTTEQRIEWLRTVLAKISLPPGALSGFSGSSAAGEAFATHTSAREFAVQCLKEDLEAAVRDGHELDAQRQLRVRSYSRDPAERALVAIADTPGNRKAEVRCGVCIVHGHVSMLRVMVDADDGERGEARLCLFCLSDLLEYAAHAPIGDPLQMWAEDDHPYDS